MKTLAKVGLKITGCMILVLFLVSAKGDEAGLIAEEDRIADEMIKLIKTISNQRYPNAPIKRFNQVKSLGCLQADFHIDENFPEDLKKGLFAQAGSHPAQIRFANASKEDDSEKDLRGMSIKVFDVEGKPLWGKAGEQDFLLNSYPALFAATPDDFLKFIRAVEKDRVWWYFINPFDSHFGALRLLLKARGNPTSPFDIRYWSTTPFQLGDATSNPVKYSVQSCSGYQSKKPDTLTENYLSEAMQAHLEKEPACFDFMLQQQTEPESMPVEDASVIWDESDSPFIKVATITIADQDFLSEEVMNQCEQMSFNPWQSLPEHKPLGGINRVRNKVYQEISEYRSEKNKPR